MEQRLYTVAEANAILPEVRRLVGAMLNARAEVVQRTPALWPVIQAKAANGGGKDVSAATRYIVVIQEAMHALRELNILVKDINTGLIDFPAERDGRLVLLCWQHDEPAVEFWHEVEAGFSGRQPIDDSF